MLFDNIGQKSPLSEKRGHIFSLSIFSKTQHNLFKFVWDKKYIISSRKIFFILDLAFFALTMLKLHGGFLALIVSKEMLLKSLRKMDLMPMLD